MKGILLIVVLLNVSCNLSMLKFKRKINLVNKYDINKVSDRYVLKIKSRQSHIGNTLSMNARLYGFRYCRKNNLSDITFVSEKLSEQKNENFSAIRFVFKCDTKKNDQKKYLGEQIYNICHKKKNYSNDIYELCEDLDTEMYIY